jgi:DNA polymerase (family X)
LNKQELSEILEEIATLLELKGENPFKSRAYIHAARVIASLEMDLVDAVKTGQLRKLKGIGDALFDKIRELVTTGKLSYYDELKASVPSGLLQMIEIPGLGPKRAKIIHDKLGVATIGELEYACHENRLLDLEGFGSRMQGKILEGIQYMKRHRGQFHYPVAYEEAQAIYNGLGKHPQIRRVEIAGSLRRKKETVKDIDFVASAKSSDAIMKAFTSSSVVEEVIARGATKSSVRLRSGLQADLRVVTEAEFPFALHHFTGSKEHNIAMRGRAQKMGIKMNEYGLFRGKKLIPCKDEKDIFSKLGLSYIPPELREDMGEIQAAEDQKLPRLIEDDDIRGIFHTHTTYSDGNGTLEEMVQAAKAAGYEYIGISDHSQSAKYARGLEVERVHKQQREIDSLQKRYPGIAIFKGIECDIHPDGTLDYSDDILATFDFVIASVHSKFKMTEEDMTRRVIKAIRNPYVTMLGHPTGRLLLSREGYPINLQKIIDAACERGVIIELNAHPYRLDLDWRMGLYAREKGLSISINPDAHSTEGIKDVRYGVGVARKGWFTRDTVFNTRSASEIKKALSKRKN